MKKIIAMVLLVIGFTSFAQEGNRLSPEQQTELQIKKMTLDLDLNASQQNKLKPILLENHKKKEERFKKMQAKRTNQSKLTKEERYEMNNELLDNQIALKAKMKDILTPAQFEKWNAQREEMSRKGKNKINRKKNN